MSPKREYTPKQKAALDAYAKAEREAFAALQASPRPTDLNSPEALAYFKIEHEAWAACERVLNEPEEEQK